MCFLSFVSMALDSGGCRVAAGQLHAMASRLHDDRPGLEREHLALCAPAPAVEGRQRGRLLCRTPPAALRDPLPPTDLAPVPVVTSHPISMLGFCPGPAEKEVKPPCGSPRGVLVVSRQLGSCCQWPQPGGSPVEAGGRPSSAGKPGCSHCPAPPPILEWASQQTGTQARNQVRTGQSPRCLQRWSDTRQ